MILGSHLSVAGGISNALVKAGQFHFDTVAVFVRNQRQWSAPPLSAEAAATFRRTREELGISPVVAHGSYLLNLAGEEAVRRSSIAAMIDELDRCDRLGIEFYVFHPGCCGDLDEGLARIAGGLREILPACPATKILLETTAGQGSSIGWRFEHLSAILERLDWTGRCGVCLDTCHVFAAGYDIRTPAAYRRTMEEFDRHVGLGLLGAVHVNDSLRDLGSRVDRHAHIGHGKIGRRGFGNFVNDPRLASVPLILETPKEIAPDGRDWDLVNAETLRKLVKKA